MAINPFVLKVLMMFLRYGLVFVAGAIGLAPAANKLIDDDTVGFEQTTVEIAAVVVALFTMLYGYARKYWDEQKLKTALATPNVMTEKQCEVRIALGASAPVGTDKDKLPKH